MRGRLGRVLLASIAGNAAVAGLKILGGVLSGSTALLADGSDSVLNTASAAVAYWALAEASKPPDEQHPYGHQRVETYGAVIILVLMAVTFSFVAFQALDKLQHGVHEKVDPVGILFAAVSLSLNLVITTLLRATGRESTVASVEARHTFLDVVEGLVTLSGVSLGSLLSGYFDLLAAIVIVVLVAYFMVDTLASLKRAVVDTSPPQFIMDEIQSVLESAEGVLGFHNLRARKVHGKIYADVHLEMDPRLPLEDVHRTCDEIEKKLRSRIGDIDIVIHVEPSTGEKSTGHAEESENSLPLEGRN